MDWILEVGLVGGSGAFLYTTRNIWKPMLGFLAMNRVLGVPSVDEQATKLREESFISQLPNYIDQALELRNLRHREIAAAQTARTEAAEATLAVVRKRLKENVEKGIIESSTALMLPSIEKTGRQEVQLAHEAFEEQLDEFANKAKTVNVKRKN